MRSEAEAAAFIRGAVIWGSGDLTFAQMQKLTFDWFNCKVSETTQDQSSQPVATITPGHKESCALKASVRSKVVGERYHGD